MTTKEIYDIWFASSKVTDETKQLMTKLTSAEIEEYFSDKSFKFGTSGVRTHMGPGTTLLNEITYTQLAIGLARWIIQTYGKGATWIVGHDNRYNSDTYSFLIAQILASHGINVSLFENNKLMPTPIISYTINHLKANGAVIVTASHNPKTDNGFKVYQQSGGQILPNQANEIIKFLPTWQEALDFEIQPTISINYLTSNVVDDYFNDIKKWLSLDKEIIYNEPIIFSAMHGTASEYMGPFLRSLGFNVIEVKDQCFPSSEFINAPIVNPEEPKAFNLALQQAESMNAKVMLACDPDADRLGIAIKHNGKWTYLNGNQSGIIQSWYQLMRFKESNIKKTPVIISTYVSTNYIDRLIKPKNGLVMRTPTGFKWIAAQMQKLTNNEHYINGFEEAIGGLPSTLDADKDSFQVAALILKIMNDYASQNMDLIDILENIIYPKYGHWFGKTISTIIPGNDWEIKAQELIKKLSFYESIKIGNRTITSQYYNQAGECLVWTLENDSWIEFRLSGTEPKFKTYFNLYPLNDSYEIDHTFSEKLEQEVDELMLLIRNYLGL